MNQMKNDENDNDGNGDDNKPKLDETDWTRKKQTNNNNIL